MSSSAVELGEHDNTKNAKANQAKDQRASEGLILESHNQTNGHNTTHFEHPMSLDEVQK